MTADEVPEVIGLIDAPPKNRAGKVPRFTPV
jgi:hypothetical protein